MAWLKEGYEMGYMVLKTNMFPMPTLHTKTCSFHYHALVLNCNLILTLAITLKLKFGGRMAVCLNQLPNKGKEHKYEVFQE